MIATALLTIWLSDFFHACASINLCACTAFACLHIFLDSMHATVRFFEQALIFHLHIVWISLSTKNTLIVSIHFCHICAWNSDCWLCFVDAFLYEIRHGMQSHDSSCLYQARPPLSEVDNDVVDDKVVLFPHLGALGLHLENWCTNY